MSAWSRTVLAAALALSQVGLAAAAETASPPPPAAPERRMLEDFEAASAARWGLLDPGVPERRRGRLQWRRDICRRSGAQGRCLRLEYGFDSPTPSQVSFRIDLGDLDASRFDHLEVWVRGDAAVGYAPSIKVGFRRPKPGTDGNVEDGTAVLDGIRAGWRKFVVPLGRLAGIRDWRHVSAFFVALESRRAGRAVRGAFEIDDVALLRTGSKEASVDDEVVPRRKVAWLKSVGGPAAARALVRARLAGWPERLLADRATLPGADREFLETVARDTWRGIAALTDRENGLPVDHVVFSGSPRAPASSAADYTSTTNVGLHLIATVAAHDLGLIAAPLAAERLRRVLDTLDRLETYRGFFFNYYDTTSLERTSNLVSFVDSSWLTAGLIVVRQAFPELAARCTRRIEEQSYRFFYDEVAQQMSHGYYVNVPTRSEYHYGALYTEARLGSLIALGKGDAPEEHWFALLRTYPPEIDWQTQPPRAPRWKTVRGHSFESGTYEWKGLRYVPSWGGSMFEALMPVLVVDETRYAPRSLGRNDEMHARVQQRFAVEELGDAVWGAAPAFDPSGGGYGEFGVKPLGTLGYRSGAVAPYAAALALAVIPEAATANLRRLAERYAVYGEFGFYDAVNPKSGEVAYQYLALDQAMMLIALANHLQDHCIQKRFAADPIARRALGILADEDFFD